MARPRTPEQERDRARQAYEDLLQELGFDHMTRVGLMAAASAWAKSERAWAVAQFVEAREHVG